MQDAQRALGLVRHHAAEWGLDPNAWGCSGFRPARTWQGMSPGTAERASYSQDPDRDDPRGADFVVFIYGGGFLDTADKSKFREGFSVPSDAPPAFFLVAHDDKSNPVEAAMLYLDYKKQNLSAELHICARVDTALACGRTGIPSTTWPAALRRVDEESRLARHEIRRATHIAD